MFLAVNHSCIIPAGRQRFNSHIAMPGAKTGALAAQQKNAEVVLVRMGANLAQSGEPDHGAIFYGGIAPMKTIAWRKK
jgi:hypothetical protein